MAWVEASSAAYVWAARRRAALKCPLALMPVLDSHASMLVNSRWAQHDASHQASGLSSAATLTRRRTMQNFTLRSMIKGAGSFVLPVLRTTHRAGGTVDADHCYALFLRYYSYLRRFWPSPRLPRVVAELGPGSSLGTGLAELLAGAEEYIALDLEVHRTEDRDLQILDRLVELFRRRTAVPVSGRHAQTFPMPVNSGFPPELDAALATSLAADRLQRLRADVREQRGDMVRYVAPWVGQGCLVPSTLDWLFSHSVLEHVDDLPAAYAAMACWLRPAGLMTHL